MKIIAEYGNERIAKVYVAKMRESGEDESGKERLVEFVESVQPPLTREQKWVLIVSSMFGCPIKCRMCDAGGNFAGRLTTNEILSQVDYLVQKRYPGGTVPVSKFKIQFARMGEPSMNHAVLDAMERLPSRFDAPGLNVSLSTVAPRSDAVSDFFEKLIKIKEDHYTDGRFQLQFSIHTSDAKGRDDLIPIKKWTFQEISTYGHRFANVRRGDKKVTLNFAPTKGYPIDAAKIRREFDPDTFMIKLTPLNPTVRSSEESLSSAIDPEDRNTSDLLVESFRREGFDVVLSIGELEENRIGSNCGQFIQRAINSKATPRRSYELDHYLVRGT